MRRSGSMKSPGPLRHRFAAAPPPRRERPRNKSGVTELMRKPVDPHNPRPYAIALLGAGPLGVSRVVEEADGRERRDPIPRLVATSPLPAAAKLG
jgi:hypothetical protein